MTVLRQKLAPFGQRFVFVRQSTPDVPRTAHLQWRRVEQRSEATLAGTFSFSRYGSDRFMRRPEACMPLF